MKLNRYDKPHYDHLRREGTLTVSRWKNRNHWLALQKLVDSGLAKIRYDDGENTTVFEFVPGVPVIESLHQWQRGYTYAHEEMLYNLSLKQLQRLYRIRTLARRLASHAESRAKDRYPKSSADHKEIDLLQRRRVLCDRQRWAIEEMIAYKRRLNRFIQVEIDLDRGNLPL